METIRMYGLTIRTSDAGDIAYAMRVIGRSSARRAAAVARLERMCAALLAAA